MSYCAEIKNDGRFREWGTYEGPIQRIKFQPETLFGTEHPVYTANIRTDVTDIKHKTQIQAAKTGVTAEDLNRG